MPLFFRLNFFALVQACLISSSLLLLLLLLQVTQLTKGFTLMQAQLKMAKGGVTQVEGDKFADVVEPFLDKAKVSCGIILYHTTEYSTQVVVGY